MNKKPEFKPKITPEQVNKALKKKNNPGKNKEAEKAEEKPKGKRKREIKPAKFPVKTRINDYSFLHFKAGVLKALGWQKGMAVTISKNEDGSITIQKA